MGINYEITELRRENLRGWIDKNHDGSQAKFVEKTGINQGELSGLLKDKSFGEKKARNLEIQADMPKFWLDDHHEAAGDNPIYKEIEDSDYTINQYHDVRAGMGNGLVLRGESGQITGWKVTPEWIAKNVPNNSGRNNLSIVTGFGDSMRGMFNSGDPLLIDGGVKSLEFDGVYFFRIGDEGFIKTLQRIPGDGVRVISIISFTSSFNFIRDSN